MGARWNGETMQRPLEAGTLPPMCGTVSEQRATNEMRRERDAALAEVERLRQAIGDHMIVTVAAGRPSNADEALWAC